MTPDNTNTSLLTDMLKLMTNMKVMMTAFVFSAIALIFLESTSRKNFPNSMLRPTNTIDYLTTLLTRFFSWIGFQFARLTDIYYLIKELFPYEDIRRLTSSIWNLFASFFHLFKGYHDYYTDALTPLQYGLVSSSIVIGLLGLSFHYFWRPSYGLMLYNIFHNIRSKVLK